MGAGVDLIELAAEILELHVLGVDVGVCEGGAQQAVCDKADNGDEGDDAPEHGVGPRWRASRTTQTMLRM